MKHIVTYSGECFTPLQPDPGQIHIEDIAHSLSLLCRANGHIDRFYSIAQHCINCANEAKARQHTARVQLAALLHDGSEAYISDITRPVKHYLEQYRDIERQLQDVIFETFLGDVLTEAEFQLVDIIDNEILLLEFEKLHPIKLQLISQYSTSPLPEFYSSPSFETRPFEDVETEFLKVFYGIMHAGLVQGR